MNRRGFFSRFGKAVAGAVLAAHLDFGSLLPVPELVREDLRGEIGECYIFEWAEYRVYGKKHSEILHGKSPIEVCYEQIDRAMLSQEEFFKKYPVED